MPERRIDSFMWDDIWFQTLDPRCKLLFIYLWTNPHCSAAGVYEISLRTIAFETSLVESEVPQLLEGLVPKVAWFPSQSIVWVKNFIRLQSRSPMFLVAVAKALEDINHPDIVSQVLAYNTLAIPYRQHIDSPSILTPDPPNRVSRVPQSPAEPSPAEPSPAKTEPPPKSPQGDAATVSDQDSFSPLAQTTITLYEQNIGPLTHIICDKIALYIDTEFKGDESWITLAFNEAATANVRKWNYVKAILQRWSNNGGPTSKPPAKPSPQNALHSKETPEQFTARLTSGKYGHVVKTSKDLL